MTRTSILRFQIAGKWSGRFTLLMILIFRCLIVSPARAEDAPTGQVVDRIVAFVNNDIILQSDVDKALAPYLQQIKERQLSDIVSEQMMARAKKEILNDLINEKLITQKASEIGITVSENEINDALENMRKAMHASQEEFIKSLAGAGYTLDEYRQQIRNQILKSRLLSQEVKSRTVVTTEEIRKYYQDHKGTFPTGIRYHLKHILIVFPKDATPAEKQAVQAKIEEIYKKIKGGGIFGPSR